MAVYTLAFLAHIAEWLFGSRSKVARASAALAAPAAGAVSAVSAVSAAPAVKVAQRGGTELMDRPKVVVRSTSDDRGATDGIGAAGTDEQGELYGRIAI